MNEFLEDIMNNNLILLFSVLTTLDIFLGSIRAIKEKKWNSTVGINGALRKVAMIGALLFLLVADKLLNINFLNLLPEAIRGSFSRIGLAGVFGIWFLLYESISVLKNMMLCGLPVPKKLKNKMTELLNDFSIEMEDKK